MNLLWTAVPLASADGNGNVDIAIEDMDVSEDHFVLYERHDGLPRIRLIAHGSRDSDEWREKTIRRVKALRGDFFAEMP